jgi:hypothetical protein
LIFAHRSAKPSIAEAEMAAIAAMDPDFIEATLSSQRSRTSDLNPTIAEIHSGTVAVQSSRGQGTFVTLHFPEPALAGA